MTGFYPTNQNTLYLLHLFYSDNEIITVHGRPAICTLIGWIETSRLCLSFNKVSWLIPQSIVDAKIVAYLTNSNLDPIKNILISSQRF